MQKSRGCRSIVLSLSVLSFVSTLAIAAERKPLATSGATSHRAYEAMVAKAVAYLRTSGQAKDGSFSRHAGPGVTALVTTGLLRHGSSPDGPLVSRSLKYLESFVQPSGGIHDPESLYRNYETCLAVMCFGEANKDGRYTKVLNGAERFLKGIQWDEDEGHKEDSFSFGGGGYGKHRRPDLSNTAFLIEALRNCGCDEKDAAIQRALIFISRCQNLESSHNTTPFASKVNDGGSYYTCAAGGKSQSGETANGGLRSYGSMTYQGLKSMIYAGVGPEDQRVKAAMKWIRKNYGLETNPGLGDSGLYYYYTTFAKALDTMGMDLIEDESGTPHDWRAELRQELHDRQLKNGSWHNENARWLEGDANLVTGYALLALSHCRPRASALTSTTK